MTSDELVGDEVDDQASGRRTARQPEEGAVNPDVERPARPGAQAASRARRIGGRPRPHPTPAVDADRPEQPAQAAQAARAAQAAQAAQPPEPSEQPSRRRSGQRSAPAAAGERHGTRGGAVRRWLPAAAAAVVLAAVLGVAGVKGPDWLARGGVSTADREALLASVKSASQLVISYDYRHIDQDAAAAEARLTGTFKTQYAQSVATAVKTQAVQSKVVVVGTVTKAALMSVDGDQAEVVVFGQQQTTSAASPSPRLDLVSIRVTATRVRGSWLISNIVRI